MPLDAGVAYVKILPQVGPQFTGLLQSQVQGAVSRIGSRVSSIGSAMTKFVTLPIIGIGAAAVASAVKVDDALDLIRTRTGAVGKELQALEGDFKAIGSNTPADLMSIADVVAQLNQRLDITGPRLRTLARQILEGGRILDQGAISVDGITRLFGDWGVQTQEQTKLLDFLFKSSQRSGVAINDLASGVVQFGAPLRSLGFTLEESIALWAKFQAEGVNTETVMAGMRMFLSNAAEEGENAEDAFRRVTDEILRLTEAGKDAQAQDLAREWFGARTFQDVVRAIQEGRFELEGFLGELEGSKDTILGVSKETRDFAEQWQIFKNNAMAALAPLGQRLFPVLTSAIKTCGEALTSFVDVFTSLPQGVQKGVIFTLLGAATAGPFLRVAGGIMRIADSLFHFSRGATAAAGAPALAGRGGILAGFLASGPGALAVATTMTAIIGSIETLGDAAQQKTAFIEQMSQALLAGRLNTAQLHDELMKMRTTVGPIGGVYDAVALMDNIIARANQGIEGQSRNLRRLGIELSNTELATLLNYQAQGDFYGQLVVLMGALNRALGPLRNLKGGFDGLDQSTADVEQHIRGIGQAMLDIPPKVETDVDVEVSNYEQALAKLRQLERPLVTPWFIKGIVQPPAGGIPGQQAQHGWAGTVKSPTLFMAGEGNEAEDVLVVPHSKGGIGKARMVGGPGPGSGDVNGTGDVYGLVIEGDVVIADGQTDLDELQEMVARGMAAGFERMHWGAHGGG